DPSAHRRHEPSRDEEAEPGPPRVETGIGVRAAIELAEDLLLVGLWDSHSLVGNGDLDRVALAFRADSDRAAFGRVLQRVVEQDREDLAQLVAVGTRRQRLLG